MNFDLWNNQADIADPRAVFAAQQASAAPSKQNTNKKGNFLTHLLPTIGGTAGGVAGGATGGALAGTAILPGIGTAAGGLIGALLGGFAGGAGGKAVENHVEGQGIGNGVLSQGLEQGALSAGPLRLLKGAGAAVKAAPEVATGAKTLAEALSGAGEKAAAPGILGKAGAKIANKGAQMEARAGGFGIGEKASGSQPLGFYDSAKITQNLKTEGVKPGSPEDRLKQVEDLMNQKGSQIDQVLANSNKALGTADKQKIADGFMQNLNNQPGVDDLTRKKAQDFVNNFMNQVHNTQDLVNFRRGLDSQVINFNQNPDTALVAKQLAARTLRGHLTDATNTLAPGISTLNKSYSNLADAKEFLTGGAKAVSDQSQSAGGGIMGRVITGDTAQAAKSKGGAALQKLAPGQGINSPFGLPAIAGRTIPVGLLQAAGQASNMNNSTAATSPNQDINSLNTTANPMSNNMAGLSQNGGDLSSQQSQNPYGQENLLYDIQRDPKNADKYLTLYSSLDKVFNPSDSKTAIKPTSQQYGLAQGGMNALNQLSQLIQSDPSVINRNATLGQGLPIVGSLISNAAGAGAYHPLADSVLQSLIHLQTGATATPEEVKAARGQLPAPGDSPEEQQRKLQNLAQMFSPFVQGGNTAGTSSSPTDLASALASMGYGQ